MRTGKSLLSGFVVAGLLSACGGGGGDGGSSTGTSGPSATPEGAYTGTTLSSSSSALRVLVLEDGQFWSLYGSEIGGTLFVAGLVQGQGTSSGSSFTSTSVKDFGVAPAVSATLSASFVPATSFSGTIGSAGSSIGFTTTVIPASTFNYNSPALISAVSGAWTLSTIDGDTIAASIGATGALTARSASGCNISGTITPRASGKNVFNVSLSFGASPCLLPGQQAAGIALYTAPTATLRQLVIAVVDPSRTYGTAAFGTR